MQSSVRKHGSLLITFAWEPSTVFVEKMDISIFTIFMQVYDVICSLG